MPIGWGQVNKGSKATPVIFWTMVETTKDGEKDHFPMLRYYSVFNADQCTGLELPIVETRAIDPIEQAERIIANMPNKPIVAIGESYRPCYRPTADTIELPPITQFVSAEDYYDTYFHELIHSTGHGSRLKRELTTNKGNKSGYGREELVAEIGSAFLCSMAGIDNSHINVNQDSYIAGWLQAIREDIKAAIVAAGKAQKAADYITNNLKTEEA